MAHPAPDTALLPRKRPRQARSAVTVDAILEAAVRILLAEGYARLSTRRVAEVAGVSVGSLYQYFPNRAALVAELVRRRVEDAVAALSRAAEVAEAPMPVAVTAVVHAFAEEKRRGLRISLALRDAKAVLEVRRVMADGAREAAVVLAAMLERLLGRALDAAESARLALAIAALEGAVSALVETDPAAFGDPGVGDLLARMFVAALDLT